MSWFIDNSSCFQDVSNSATSKTYKVESCQKAPRPLSLAVLLVQERLLCSSVICKWLFHVCLVVRDGTCGLQFVAELTVANANEKELLLARLEN